MSSSSSLRPRRTALKTPLVALLAAGLAAPAHAVLSDTIHPFVSVAYSHDDNLLRLPDGVELPDGRSDWIKQAQAGFQFERPLGRQMFTGQARVSRVTFDHFNTLDYNGKDLNGAWEWHLGNHLDGHIGGLYSETLTPFSDFHQNQRNVRTQRREYADGGWNFHPSWRLHGGFTREKFNYELAEQSYNNRTEDQSEAGIDYLVASGSRVGLVLRKVKGIYPNHRTFGSLVIDDGYTQDEAKLSVYWRFGGVTQVQFLGGYARRAHNFFTERDVSGPDGRLSVNWNPYAPLKLTFSAWHEFSAVESTLVSSSRNKGASATAAWELTGKIRADASVKTEKRDFGTINGIVFPGTPTDDTRTSSLGLTYVPAQFLQLSAGLNHDSRSANPYIGTGNYKSNGVTLSVTAQF